MLQQYNGDLGTFEYDSDMYTILNYDGIDYLHFNDNYVGEITFPKGCNSAFRLFEGCDIKEGCFIGDNFDTSEIEYMSLMFKDCNMPKDFSFNLDTSQLFLATRMFENCKFSENFKFGEKFVLSESCLKEDMFLNCVFSETMIEKEPRLCGFASDNFLSENEIIGFVNRCKYLEQFDISDLNYFSKNNMYIDNEPLFAETIKNDKAQIINELSERKSKYKGVITESDVAKNIPHFYYKDDDFVKDVLKVHGSMIENIVPYINIDDLEKNKEFCFLALENGCYFNQIPQEMLNENVCITEIEKLCETIDDVPISLRTKNVIDALWSSLEKQCLERYELYIPYKEKIDNLITSTEKPWDYILKQEALHYQNKSEVTNMLENSSNPTINSQTEELNIESLENLIKLMKQANLNKDADFTNQTLLLSLKTIAELTETIKDLRKDLNDTIKILNDFNKNPDAQTEKINECINQFNTSNQKTFITQVKEQFNVDYFKQLKNKVVNHIQDQNEKAKFLINDVLIAKLQEKISLARVNMHKFAMDFGVQTRNMYSEMKMSLSNQLALSRSNMEKMKYEHSSKVKDTQIKTLQQLKEQVENIKYKANAIKNIFTSKNAKDFEKKMDGYNPKSVFIDTLDKAINKNKELNEIYIKQMKECSENIKKITQEINERQKIRDLDTTLQVKAGKRELEDIELSDLGFSMEQIDVIEASKKEGVNIQPYINPHMDSSKIQAISMLVMSNVDMDIVSDRDLQLISSEISAMNFFKQDEVINSNHDNKDKITKCMSSIEKTIEKYKSDSKFDYNSKDDILI